MPTLEKDVGFEAPAGGPVSLLTGTCARVVTELTEVWHWCFSIGASAVALHQIENLVGTSFVCDILPLPGSHVSQVGGYSGGSRPSWLTALSDSAAVSCVPAVTHCWPMLVP